MKVLDCETEETMYHSLYEITGISRNDFASLFTSFDLDSFYEKNPKYPELPDELFLKKLLQMANKGAFQFHITNWFHLTRTAEPEVFRKGILPLGENIDSIWDFLFLLQDGALSKEEWKSFRESLETRYPSHSAYLYRLKVPNRMHWGPYAMLIRNVAFSANEIGNHDYLAAPEIIEDICDTFAETYGFDLIQSYKNSTKPCIVKFQVKEANQKHLGIVVNYLYHRFHKMELSLHCNTCFDGGGQKIPQEAILKIEVVE
ncbi:hypothetical protein [Brevibacillus borstelensis]|uniref:hypothetical protein n=1 Tax=Brevibacillus borstelensis TaxID=45462 RepID=UPI0004694671|nr:hypothetical protein [Brevibacillus borstelensis]MCC0567096.1 hypothetical protein [Brevibacillus borstelensis]MCM3473508.1 hypothetical protein [Brevibacillus borstelensis]MCM3561456.1 hypothetical protein [Brevibacillus borstelensis]MCM3593593.1 hypothetical protein [Brevibacillus borstelensis]MED1850034.1 hypothetical protein [Brevibacillus borstelensis]